MFEFDEGFVSVNAEFEVVAAIGAQQFRLHRNEFDKAAAAEFVCAPRIRKRLFELRNQPVPDGRGNLDIMAELLVEHVDRRFDFDPGHLAFASGPGPFRRALRRYGPDCGLAHRWEW